jgi:hypothetical protein
MCQVRSFDQMPDRRGIRTAQSGAIYQLKARRQTNPHETKTIPATNQTFTARRRWRRKM